MDCRINTLKNIAYVPSVIINISTLYMKCSVKEQKRWFWKYQQLQHQRLIKATKNKETKKLRVVESMCLYTNFSFRFNFIGTKIHLDSNLKWDQFSLFQCDMTI